MSNRVELVLERLDSLVYESLLYVAESDCRDAIYDGASSDIDEALFRLSVAREVAPAWMAMLLHRMEQGSLFFALGRSNLYDYAREELGLTPSMVIEALRLGRAFERFPVFFDLILDGKIAASQVKKLLRLLRDDSEIAGWVAKLDSLSAVDFAAEVDAEAKRQEASGPDASREAEIERISFLAPPDFLVRWQMTLELARKLEGPSRSPFEVTEMMLGEWTAKYGSAADPDVEMGKLASAREAREASRAESLRICRNLDKETNRWEFLGWKRPSFGLPAPVESELRDGTSDPREVHRRLLYLVKLARGIDARVGRLLWNFRRLARTRRMLFLNFSHYVKERLRMSPSRANDLLAVDKKSFERPAVAAAYWTGELTWFQVKQLVRLPEYSDGFKQWIERAKSVSVARLTEEIDAHLVEVAQPRSKVRGFPPADPAGLPAEAAPAGTEVLDPARVVSNGRIQVFLSGPEDGIAQLRTALASIRLGFGRPEMEDWECFDMLIANFWRNQGWLELEEVKKDQRIYARDRYRCQMPGCRNLASGMHIHHIRFKSLGGGNEDDNLLLVCSACHARVIHAGHAAVTGRVSEGLRFELGLRAGQAPLSVWVSGERRAERIAGWTGGSGQPTLKGCGAGSCSRS